MGDNPFRPLEIAANYKGFGQYLVNYFVKYVIGKVIYFFIIQAN